MLRLGLGVAAGCALADQASKWAVYAAMTGLPFWGAAPAPLPRAATIEITGIFNLVTVWNFGVSFGMFNRGSAEAAWVFAALASAVTIGLVLWLRRAETRMVALALGLVIGGAVGNVIDRIRFGAVFDFLDLHLAGWHWPAFNIADAGITIGVALLLVDALFAPRSSAK